MRRARGRWRVVALVLGVVLIVAACSSDDGGGGSTAGSGSGSSGAGDPSRDKLAQILARGTIVLPTDPLYPPASFSVEGATRPIDTLCEETQLTGPELDGYDIAVSKAVAEDLGVEPCFVVPTFTEIIAGNWADRWDLAFASIGITGDRMANLYFTQPYYATPESFFVREDAPYEVMEDLDGARIGVCTGCFADLYLQHTLDIPGVETEYRVDDAEIVGYSTELKGLDDVDRGDLDAFLCQDTVGNQAIAQGMRLRAIDPEAYTAYIGGAIDRTSGLSATALYDRVNQILVSLHADGTLRSWSEEYFGVDYASAAGAFDVDALEQTVD